MARQRVHLDLGDAWQRISGLPFVYAAWVPGPRASRPRPELESILRAALEGAARQAPAVAAEGARALGVEVSRMRRYYAEEIRYDLDDRAREGLKRFGAMLSVAQRDATSRCQSVPDTCPLERDVA
jgi:predicted solute-binding protein